MRTGELYQRYYGLFLARVISANDPKRLGRVRVECDQFEDEEHDEVWLPVARPAAGDESGVYFTPKKDDQVIIGFLAGDVNEPVILGFAHSTKRPRPEQVDENKHAIVTTIGSVVFDETGRTISVTLSGPPKSSITLGPTGVTIESDLLVRVTSKTSVSLEAPVLNFAGIPNFGPPAVLPPVPTPATFAFADLGVNFDTGSKRFCVNGQGVALEHFVTLLYNAHTHNSGVVAPPDPAFLVNPLDPDPDKISECGP
jgi:hypothetical protein